MELPSSQVELSDPLISFRDLLIFVKLVEAKNIEDVEMCRDADDRHCESA